MRPRATFYKYQAGVQGSIYRDSFVLVLFLGFIFKAWVHSLAAEHPLSKWEDWSSIPAQKERGGGREGERGDFIFKIYKHSVKKQLGIFQRK